MNFKKLISLFLAALMLCSALTSLSVVSVSAEEEAPEAGAGTTTDTIERIDHYTAVFGSPEEKLAAMKHMTTKGGYAIYADPYSGEVAVKDLATEQILFTNPYDVGASTTTNQSIKNQILSQIIVKFTENGREKEYTSYEYAALKDQIKVKNIKNGIRVEYAIGREEAKRLVPRSMKESRFVEHIKTPLEEYYGVTYEDAQVFREESGHPLQSASFYLCKMMAYYMYQSLDECTSDTLKQDMLNKYPVTEKMNIYILDPSTSATELERIEQTIRAACPNYTFEEMEADHMETEYVSEDENPPLFKMALEYTITEDGFDVRMPANGIRFNEDKFTISDITILPYMGAGNNANTGYTFFPDGSGALFSFEDLKGQVTTSVASKLYGVDYAYHTISGTYQQTVRYPVFGVVENTRFYDCVAPDEETGEDKTTTINGAVYDAYTAAKKNGANNVITQKYDSIISVADIEEYTVNRGYVAIIEEGDALAELLTYHAGVLSPYDTVQMRFNPRPNDSYNIADAISVGTNSMWTVTSPRKYVGNYKVHYIMLSDKTRAAENGVPATEYYDSTWLGMALAYRDYLVNKGVLTPLGSENTSEDIPLYIESFGAIETIEKILSIPVEVKKPLTSAEDVITMYEELSGKGVTNINFKLTGFANGGMYSTMPGKLKWEKAVTEETSMQELFDYAAGVTDGSMGVYPDFDFSYVVEDKLFDGFTLRKHAIRTIDDRYTYKREYMATQQKYGGYFHMVVSPAYFDVFYTKLMKNYLKHDNLTGISVGSLGTALNSDFDEDDPYNREDSKSFIMKALEYIGGQSEDVDVMVDGGNAYTWQFADHILNAPLDSSRYIRASYSVPFVGVVLHGYKNFAGTPLNMEGDLNYAKLKAIENGASVYFTLSYQNTQDLKEDEWLNKYYSVRYDIWFDDVVEIYNELNTQLKDVQDKIIIDHQFLSGMRVPDTNELDRDTSAEFDAVLDFQQNQAEYLAQQKAESVADARDKIASAETMAKNFVKDCLAYYDQLSGVAYTYVTGDRSLERRLANYMEAMNAYNELMAEYEAATPEEKKAMREKVANTEAIYKRTLGQLKTFVRTIGRSAQTIQKQYDTLLALREAAISGELLIKGTEGCPQSIIDEIEVQLANTEKYMAEGLGLSLNLTADKAEVDTVMYAHIATLLYSTYGDDNHANFGIVGKAENIYEMLKNETYGLMISELGLLRYLDANQSLTDAELIAKYGLTETGTSVDGLVKYMQELLGESHKFDPQLVALAGGVEQNIRDYFVSALYKIVLALTDANILPTLNFSTTRVNERGKEVDNVANVNIVIDQVNKALDTAIAAKIETVTNGDYDFDGLFTAEEKATLLAEMTTIVKNNIKTRENPTPKNPVDYKTIETLEEDLTYYMESYYYRTVIKTIAPSDAGKATLAIQTVTYRTDSSISLLTALRLKAYGSYDASVKYGTLYNKLVADTDYAASLDVLAAALNTNYGDVRAALETAFLKTFSTTALGRDREPALSTLKATETTNLRKAAAAILAEKLPTATLADVPTIINDVVAAHGTYELKEGYDAVAASTEYVVYNFFKKLAGMSADLFYFDNDLAKMDAAVRAKVAETKAEILAALPAEHTVYDLYSVALACLADPNDSVYAFAEELAGQIRYAPTGNASLPADVRTYYIYMLFASLDETLGTAPTLSIQGGSSAETKALNLVSTNIKNRTDVLLAEAKAKVTRGILPNYSLDALLTVEEQEAVANELMDALISAGYAQESERETLKPELLAFFRHSYNTSVLSLIGGAEATNIRVSEVYGASLMDSTKAFKDMMYYFVTTLTDLTAEDIDRLVGGSLGDDDGDGDGEASRYLSDDGRIVSVTYGTENADGSYASYKTFVLNYNNFSVNVEYDGVTYTIPAYGYVVVMHGSGT